jgi:hypothetical protein
MQNLSVARPESISIASEFMLMQLQLIIKTGMAWLNVIGKP